MDIKKLKESGSITKQIQWPGTKESFLVKVLNESNFIEAEAYCDNLYFKDSTGKGKGREIQLGNLDERTHLKDIYLVYLSCVNSDGTKCFDTFAIFTECITPSVANELYAMQSEWQEQCSPNFDNLTQETFDKIIDEIKKKPETVETISSINLLRNLLTTTVNRLVNSQTENFTP